MMKNKKRKGRRAQSQTEQKAKLDSASELTSQYNAIQLNPKGSCTAYGSKGSTAILNVCTYNARTLRTGDDRDGLIDEVEQIQWDITGLCETYRKVGGGRGGGGACQKLEQDTGFMK